MDLVQKCALVCSHSHPIDTYTLPVVTRRDFSVVNGNPLAHARLSVSRGVVVSHAAAETIEGSHLFLSQGKIEDGQVLDEALHLLGLGNGDGTSLYSPTQKDLRGGLGIAIGDISDHFLADDGRLVAF